MFKASFACPIVLAALLACDPDDVVTPQPSRLPCPTCVFLEGSPPRFEGYYLDHENYPGDFPLEWVKVDYFDSSDALLGTEEVGQNIAHNTYISHSVTVTGEIKKALMRSRDAEDVPFSGCLPGESFAACDD